MSKTDAAKVLQDTTIMRFVSRWLFAFALLAATYNPTPYCYMRWVAEYGQQNLSIAVLLGLILLVAYIIYLRATLRSIGAFGMALVVAVFGACIWVLTDLDLLTLDDPGLNTWLGLLALSAVLGVGLNWSHVRRRLSGQADMDGIDE